MSVIGIVALLGTLVSGVRESVTGGVCSVSVCPDGLLSVWTCLLTDL